MTHEIADRVPSDSPGAREIGFAIPQRYNASRILFDNLSKGRSDRLALTGPAGRARMLERDAAVDTRLGQAAVGAVDLSRSNCQGLVR